MISAVALDEFKAIWRSEFGAEIANDVAMDEAVNLLVMFAAVYHPIKQEWLNEYENATKTLTENQPSSATL